MNLLNNDISDAAIIKTLCQHNKKHIQEIDRLQTLNKGLEELIAELRTKLERLEEIEAVFDIIEKDIQYTDKQLMAVVRKLDYIKDIKEQAKNTQRNYSKLKKDYARLFEQYSKLNLWRYEMERSK